MATALFLLIFLPGADVSVGVTAIVVAIIAAFGTVGAAMATRASPKAATRTTEAGGSEWAEMLEQQRRVNRVLADEIDRLRDELAEERRECDRRIADLEAQITELRARFAEG